MLTPFGLFIVSKLHCAHIHYMHVGAESHIISQVPARMIRIVVDDDVIGVPEPAVAITYVIGCDTPGPTIEPEATGASAADVPYVMWSEAAGKVPMLPGMINMVVSIIGA